ncbi:MAG: hypothetical protein N4A57_08075 [Anaeromicrobium sp.]|jgi:hypothetical protein|uniref:hypothetical protein n=1 Tax=Anaeromicrobium sp. TaxID=1929132 RepID=UPI0025D3D238|nr:hypothetical protein [Anaeromicrobium sp.]MCT4594208.1 hypothetical protein [Anaeromicrobium sp.]
MKYDNILIPFVRKNNQYIDTQFGFIIQPMHGYKIGINAGYIIMSSDPSLKANIFFRFFKVGGDKDFYEYRGQVISIQDLKNISYENFNLVNNLVFSTINQFYNPQCCISSTQYNYLIEVIEYIDAISFNCGFDNRSITKDYETQVGYEGKVAINTFTEGRGKSIDEIVRMLKNEYGLSKMTRNIYKFFLSNKGLNYLISRIIGKKETDIFATANGGRGYSNNTTYLFNSIYNQSEIEELRRLCGGLR